MTTYPGGHADSLNVSVRVFPLAVIVMVVTSPELVVHAHVPTKALAPLGFASGAPVLVSCAAPVSCTPASGGAADPPQITLMM
jgi:hypothetical protein